MWTRHAIVLLGLLGPISAAFAQDFHIQEMSAPANWTLDGLKPGTIQFNDQAGAAADSNAGLIPFDDWARQNPIQKRFLSLFPGYSEPTKAASDKSDGDGGKLYMYVAQARFMLDRAPGAIDLSRDVTLPFLERIDPAIKHTLISAADVKPLKSDNSAGNDDPDRKWCTGRTTSICIQSSYKLEGKIPIGIMLVNKLRDSAKKVSDHIDFESELSALSPADVDQAGLQQLTALDTPIRGVLEQNIFYVNQIMRFGKFFAVFQGHPTDPGKTVVTAYMALAIDGSVFEKKKEYENVPVLRNLVPEQVLMGKSSFNSGDSISAGLPKYARNEIKTVAGLLEHDTAK
jgi:hypothetical protein